MRTKTTEPYYQRLQVLRSCKYTQAAMRKKGLVWYKFNIYFRIFLSIILLLNEISTTMNSTNEFWFVLLYDSAVIVWLLLMRHWLAFFKYKGVINYFAIQFGLPILNFLISSVALACGDSTSFANSAGRVIACALLFIPEFIYWKKRIFLFDKKVRQKDLGKTNQQLDTDGYKRVCFCRKCGNRLSENSRFCGNCGTEIIENVEVEVDEM